MTGLPAAEPSGLAYALGKPGHLANGTAPESCYVKYFVPPSKDSRGSTLSSVAVATAKTLKVGARRQLIVADLDGVVKSFTDIYPHTRGAPQDRLQKALGSLRSTPAGRRHELRKTSKDDLDFMVKIARANNEGTVPLDEWAFAFRAWLLFTSLQESVLQIHSRVIQDSPDGYLCIDGLRTLLTELNDGEDVSDREVDFVNQGAPTYAPAYGEEEVEADYRPLTLAATIWYCDIAGLRSVPSTWYRRSVSMKHQPSFTPNGCAVM